MSKGRFPRPSQINPPSLPPGDVTSGLEDGDEPNPPATSDTSSDAAQTEFKSDREFGKVDFAPTCGTCNTKMKQLKTDGPMAWYRCETCPNRTKVSRPWRPIHGRPQGPNVAARPDMK